MFLMSFDHRFKKENNLLVCNEKHKVKINVMWNYIDDFWNATIKVID